MANHPSEERLDQLRAEARARGQVTSGRGVDVAGGPIPKPLGGHLSGATEGPGPGAAPKPGYHGLSALKPPVWTWEIPAYFFVGGMSGMSAVIALMAWCFRHPDLARAAAWIGALGGGVVSPALLIMDLGRPERFLNMLRVFKPQSAMSAGAWILSFFGATVFPAAILVEALHWHFFGDGFVGFFSVVATLLLMGAAVFGTLLATYTGVLFGATAVPAWVSHHRLLPVHFGVAGMGAAVSALELFGFGRHYPALWRVGLAAALVETFLWVWLNVRRHGPVDRAIHHGPPGLMLQAAEILTGPAALLLRAFGLLPLADVSFLGGACLSRFGWLSAGKVSGRDVVATLASQALPGSANGHRNGNVQSGGDPGGPSHAIDPGSGESHRVAARPVGQKK